MKKLIAFLLSLLILCAAFGAPAEEPLFATFGEAQLTGLSSRSEIGIDFCATVAQKDGKLYRVEAASDDRLRDLFDAMAHADPVTADHMAAYRALSEYADTLPVTSVEEVTAVPLTQEELDALTGKTLKELREEGFWYMTPNYGEPGQDVFVELIRDIYVYSTQIEEPYEAFREMQQNSSESDLTVKHMKYDGITSSRPIHSFGPSEKTE